ncbi:MAG: sugar transferase [Eubacterium sp.]|nr:sugar transferase [Eubacterium sp.]
MNQRNRTQLALEFFIDLTAILLANLVSFCIFNFILVRIPYHPLSEWLRYGGTCLLAFALCFFGFHSKLDVNSRGRGKEFYSVLKNITLTFGFFAVMIILFKNPIVESRYMLLSSYGISVVLSGGGRYLLKRYLTTSFTKSRVASMVGVITTSDRAEEFVATLKLDWSINISGIVLLDSRVKNGVFSYTYSASKAESAIYGIQAPTAQRHKDATLPDAILDIPVIATDESFIDWIRSSPLDEIYINLPYSDDSEIKELIEELEDMGITVHVNIPSLDDILTASKFDNISCRMLHGYPTATFSAVKQNPTALVIKRLTDVVLGTVGCLVSLPIIGITAIPLLAESKGPLIFKQQRVGENGRPFYIYKLRSMYVDAEERKAELMKSNKMDGFMFKMDNDPRITKVGRVIRKLSIDELPQFFNVVKGDMSLVGTRPPTFDEFEQYEGRHKRRLSMRPGITGMWQVSGRSTIQDFEEVVELDCKYIDEWSVWLDIKILFKTVIVVLTHRGAE